MEKWHECEEESVSDAIIGFDGETWKMRIESYGDMVMIRFCPFCGVELELTE